MPLALSTAPSDTFYPSTAALQHTKQKSAGMANFSCIWYSGYSTSAYVNPGERKTRGEGGFEDGLPDHVTRKEAAMSKQQFLGKALRASRVCGERNTDAHLVQRVYFHVNRRMLCISAVKYFRPTAKSHSFLLFFLINNNKNRCHGLQFEMIEPLTQSQISGDNTWFLAFSHLVLAINFLTAGLHLAC